MLMHLLHLLPCRFAPIRFALPRRALLPSLVKAKRARAALTIDIGSLRHESIVAGVVGLFSDETDDGEKLPFVSPTQCHCRRRRNRPVATPRFPRSSI